MAGNKEYAVSLSDLRRFFLETAINCRDILSHQAAGSPKATLSLCLCVVGREMKEKDQRIGQQRERQRPGKKTTTLERIKESRRDSSGC